MILLAIILLLPMICIPFLIFYFVVKAAVKNGILDAQKSQENNQVYKNGYIVNDQNDNCSK